MDYQADKLNQRPTAMCYAKTTIGHQGFSLQQSHISTQYPVKRYQISQQSSPGRYILKRATDTANTTPPQHPHISDPNPPSRAGNIRPRRQMYRS